MSSDILLGSTIADMRNRAGSKLRSAVPPGAPDEAWRRVPPEMRDSVFRISDSENTFTPGLFTASLSGDGELLGTGGKERDVREIEVSIRRWGDMEQLRTRDRLSRPNDVEDQFASLFNLANSHDLYLLRLKGDSGSGILRAQLVLDLTAPDKKNTPLMYLPFVLVQVEDYTSAELEIILSDRVDVPHSSVAQFIYLIGKGAKLSLYGDFSAIQQNHLTLFERSYQEAQSVLKFGRNFDTAGCLMYDSRHALLGEFGELRHYCLQRPRFEGFTGQKTVVEQYAPHTFSTVESRSVLNDRSRSLFVGTVKIPTGAEKSEAYEQHRTLMLSPDARVESLPELEIVENEVSCSHASSIREISTEDLFYLNSRGVPTEEARKLLTEAFIGEVQSRMLFEKKEESEHE